MRLNTGKVWLHMKMWGKKRKNLYAIWKSWYWILKLEGDDEDAGGAFITDQWVSERGTPSLCITGAQQEAILKWGAFPRALSHPWHLSVCACVKCLAWRVGAYVSAQRPNCLRSPATCSSFSTPTSHHWPSIGPSFSFTYSFKSKKCLLRSNMGLR